MKFAISLLVLVSTFYIATHAAENSPDKRDDLKKLLAKRADEKRNDQPRSAGLWKREAAKAVEKRSDSYESNDYKRKEYGQSKDYNSGYSNNRYNSYNSYDSNNYGSGYGYQNSYYPYLIVSGSADYKISKVVMLTLTAISTSLWFLRK